MATFRPPTETPVTGGLDGPKRYWPKRVLAAWLRIMGATWEQAGASVGRHGDTVRKWSEDRESWALARRQAHDLFIDDLHDASARAVLQTLLAGNADIGLKVLERLEPQLAPPSAAEGGPGANVNVGVLMVPAPVSEDGWSAAAREVMSGRNGARALPAPQQDHHGTANGSGG